LSSKISNNERCTQEIKSNVAMAKAALKNKKYFQQQIGLNLLEEKGNLLYL